MGAGFAAAAQEVAGLVGSIATPLIQGAQQRRNSRQEFKYNRALADYAYSKDLDMWNKENQYNSPAAQMQRLKDAGLSPQLVYGSGHVTGNVSGSTPKYHAPEARVNWDPMINPVQMLSQYQDFKIRQGQTKLLEQQVKNQELNNDLKRITLSNESMYAARNAQNKADRLGYESIGSFYRSQLAGYSAEMMDTKNELYRDQLKASLRNTYLRNEILRNDAFWRDAKNELDVQGTSRSNTLKSLDIRMREGGMTYSDDLFMRMLKQWIDARKGK